MQLSLEKADRSPMSEGQQMGMRGQFSTPVWREEGSVTVIR